MKKLLLSLCVFLCLGLLCSSQEVLYSYSVMSECRANNASKIDKWQYRLQLLHEDEDIIALILYPFAIPYEQKQIKTIITENNHFKISSFDFSDGDYSGMGSFSEKEITIDYTYSWHESYTETCHLTTIPVLAPPFSFFSAKIWSFLTTYNDNTILETTLYKLDGGFTSSPIDTWYFPTHSINNKDYYLLKSSNDNGKTWDEIGYLRTEQDKIYYVAKNENSEFLLYDFTLNVGDSFNGMELLAIDTINILNTQRARYTFTDDVWIKDIGSLYYPFFERTINSSNIKQELLCVKFDTSIYDYIDRYSSYSTEFIWQNPNYETCSCEQTTIENSESQYITISPNPVKNKLTLSLPNAENEIKIFDLQGKLLLQQNVGFSAEINVSMLPTGMYVLVVNGESYKFVKE